MIAYWHTSDTESISEGQTKPDMDANQPDNTEFINNSPLITPERLQTHRNNELITF